MGLGLGLGLGLGWLACVRKSCAETKLQNHMHDHARLEPEPRWARGKSCQIEGPDRIWELRQIWGWNHSLMQSRGQMCDVCNVCNVCIVCSAPLLGVTRERDPIRCQSPGQIARAREPRGPG